MMLKHLDLFSGVGGFALAARWCNGIETTQFVELDENCHGPIQRHWPGIPIHRDIRSFTAKPDTWNLLTAGFPCQDISKANPKGQGLKGEMSRLWFEVLRIIREARPTYIVLENAPSTIGRNWLRTILEGLNACGYDAQWSIVSVRSLGGRHLRNRHFVLAYPSSLRLNENAYAAQVASQDLSAIASRRWQKNIKSAIPIRGRATDIPVPRALRGSNGLPTRMDKNRIKMLGNAVSPQVAMIPLLKVLQMERSRERD